MLAGSAAAEAHAGVVLTAREQQASGIVTAPLQATTYHAQVNAIATVIDPQTLSALAARLATVRAAVTSATVAVTSATAQARRLQSLYSHGKFVSEVSEQAALAAAAAAKAQRISAVANVASVREGATATWGAALTAIGEQGAAAFADYADQRRALLAIALPVDTTAAPARTSDIVLPSGRMRTASLIGPAPRVDPVVQGPTFYYSAVGGGLRSGQRLAAAVAVGTEAARGVVIPNAALLWYGGEPWAYVETAPGDFVRRRVSTQERAPKGWFQRRGFRAGEQIVVQGAELLLSQELKPPPGTASAAGDDDD